MSHTNALAKLDEDLTEFDGAVLIESFVDPKARVDWQRQTGEPRAQSIAAHVKEIVADNVQVVTIVYGAVDTESRVLSITLIPRKSVRAARAALDAIRKATEDGAGAADAPALILPGATADDDDDKEKDKSAAADGDDTDGPAAAEKPRKPAAEPAVTSKRGYKPERTPPLGLSVLYIRAMTHPSTYDNVAYRAYDTYEHRPQSSPSTLGAGLEVEKGLAPGFGAAAGVRYVTYRGYESHSLFDPDVPDHGVDVKIDATAIGLWVDALPLYKTLSSSWIAHAGLGLDVDYAVVTAQETYQDERTGVTPVTETSKATSSETVVSLRIASGLTYKLKTVGVGVRIDVQIPMYATEPSVTVTGAPRDWPSTLDQRPAVGADIALAATLFL
jgi:hypothetical protein